MESGNGKRIGGGLGPRMSELKAFDIGALIGGAGEAFVLGIGGGSDAIGAFAVASAIARAGGRARYGLCVSEKPAGYPGFETIDENLYLRGGAGPDPALLEGIWSLKLLHDMSGRDEILGNPPLMAVTGLKSGDAAGNARFAEEAFSRLAAHMRGSRLITVDMGGDSATGGKDGDGGFDRANLRALKASGVRFTHLVLGIGCDGETEPGDFSDALDRQEEAGALLGAFELGDIADSMRFAEEIVPLHRTPNIISKAKAELDAGLPADEPVEIPRHDRKRIPRGWLAGGLAFDGGKLV
ncbi:MAG: hypothetical protein LBG62_06060 [Candidatus Methanoplasma sp.]|jgi:hypothetical protein|nr:hypothetical protein [Candidatus Methanoplasma sp.]